MLKKNSQKSVYAYTVNIFYYAFHLYHEKNKENTADNLYYVFACNTCDLAVYFTISI